MALVSIPPGLQPMRSILLALIAALCALSVSAAEQDRAPKDMVLLTVSGTIGESNRGPLDPKKDSLLALNKIEFNKAFAFDRPTLLALEQGTVTVQPREFDKPATFKGPLLREVLGHIEAAKLKITVVAINGYLGLDRAGGCRPLRLDPRARGRRRTARHRPAGSALADQHESGGREARRGWTRPLGLCRVLYAGRRVRGMT